MDEEGQAYGVGDHSCENCKEYELVSFRPWKSQRLTWSATVIDIVSPYFTAHQQPFTLASFNLCSLPSRANMMNSTKKTIKCSNGYLRLIQRVLMSVGMVKGADI